MRGDLGLAFVAIVIVGVVAMLLIIVTASNNFADGYCSALDADRSGSVCLLPDGTFEEVQRD